MTLERLSLDRAERLSAPSAYRFSFPEPPGEEAPGPRAGQASRAASGPAAAAGSPDGRGPRAAAGGSDRRGPATAANGLDGRGPAAYLSLRSEGDMRYVRGGTNPNRERFFAGLGLDPASVLGLELSHSRGVAFPLEGAVRAEAEPFAAGPGQCDGILLRDPAYAASVTVADCMPIWLHDRASGAFGVLHSGWKGTGILERALAALRERYGSGPASVSVILGPAIGSCCYAVPEERALGFAREFGAEAAPFTEGRWRLDLRAANIALARRLGVGALLSVEACTSCEESLGSFRRQGPEAFTRMAALAAYPPRLAAGRGPS